MSEAIEAAPLPHATAATLFGQPRGLGHVVRPLDELHRVVGREYVQGERLRVLEWQATAAGDQHHRVGGSEKQWIDLSGVRDVVAIHEGIEPMFDISDAPLFARRGLFR